MGLRRNSSLVHAGGCCETFWVSRAYGTCRLRNRRRCTLHRRGQSETVSDNQRFTAADICRLHRLWLSPIYAWSGEYRTVNLGKGGFQFANAALIPAFMEELERKVLQQYTPCLAAPDEAIAEALAAVQAELILVHPFRDGNGRVARLLALLMGLQAGLPPLDFSSLDGRGKRHYIAGIHAAMGHDYSTLIGMFRRVIDRTWKRVSSNNR